MIVVSLNPSTEPRWIYVVAAHWGGTDEPQIATVLVAITAAALTWAAIDVTERVRGAGRPS